MCDFYPPCGIRAWFYLSMSRLSGFYYVKKGDMMFDRVEKFIGAEALSKIKNTCVAVIGLGGVGGYAVECLVRSGIENIIILDYDTVDISNINRQIISNTTNINKYKTAYKSILIPNK